MIGSMNASTTAARIDTRPAIKQAESGLFEPGLLAVFRMVLGLQLVFALVRLGTLYPFSSVEQPVLAPHFGIPLPVQPDLATIIRIRQDQQVLSIISIGWLVLMLGYLWWPWLQRRLGQAYLPIALATVTLFILLERAITVWSWVQRQELQLLDVVTVGSGGRFWVGVLLPLVLIAWQYHFRQVVGYLFSIVLLNVLLAGWLLNSPDWLVLLRDELVPATIFGVMGYIVTRIMAGQRQQRQKLAEANAQLAQHAATLEQLTVSRERNRLARELHDTLAHTLSAVSVQLEAVDSAWEANPAKARDLLGKSLAQTRSGLTETRRALQALRASPLDDLGLALAVRNLAESTAQRGGLQLALDIPELEPLSAETEHQVYRIAQEALANVLKHAGAQTLAVQLRHTVRGYVFRVEDDGIGFTAAAPPNGHFGLQGMRERAELLGATLVVESGPGQGTTVHLTWQEEIPNDEGKKRSPDPGASHSRDLV